MISDTSDKKQPLFDCSVLSDLSTYIVLPKPEHVNRFKGTTGKAEATFLETSRAKELPLECRVAILIASKDVCDDYANHIALWKNQDVDIIIVYADSIASSYDEFMDWLKFSDLEDFRSKLERLYHENNTTNTSRSVRSTRSNQEKEFRDDSEDTYESAGKHSEKASRGSRKSSNAAKKAKSLDNGISDSDTSSLSDQQIAVNAVIDAIGERFAYHHEQRCFREYNGKYWELVDESPFKTVVLAVLKKSLIPYTDGFVNAVISLLECELGYYKWNEPDSLKFLNFENGILDLETNQLIPHSKDFLFTSCLSLGYCVTDIDCAILEALAQKAPQFYKFLSHAFNNDAQQMLKLTACWNGIIKKRFTKLQKFIYLYGESGSGKGTLLSLIEASIGSQNTAAFDADLLAESYVLAEIMDKTLAYDADTAVAIGKSGIESLKRLTGGNKIYYRAPYEKAGHDYFRGTIMLISNYSALRGNTRGIDRRFCYLQMLNPIKQDEQDPYLAEKLIDELPNILPIILSMSQDEVDGRIRGIGEYQVSEFTSATWGHKIKSCSVANFLEDRIYFANNGLVLVGDRARDGRVENGNMEMLYPNYLDLCNRDGFKSLGKTEFIERMKDHIEFLKQQLEYKIDVYYSDRTTITLEGVRRSARHVFYGLAIRDDDQIDVKTFSQEFSEKNRHPVITYLEALENKEKFDDSSLSSLPEKSTSSVITTTSVSEKHGKTVIDFADFRDHDETETLDDLFDPILDGETEAENVHREHVMTADDSYIDSDDSNLSSKINEKSILSGCDVVMSQKNENFSQKKNDIKNDSKPEKVEPRQLSLFHVNSIRFAIGDDVLFKGAFKAQVIDVSEEVIKIMDENGELRECQQRDLLPDPNP